MESDLTKVGSKLMSSPNRKQKKFGPSLLIICHIDLGKLGQEPKSGLIDVGLNPKALIGDRPSSIVDQTRSGAKQMFAPTREFIRYRSKFVPGPILVVTRIRSLTKIVLNQTSVQAQVEWTTSQLIKAKKINLIRIYKSINLIRIKNRIK